MAHLKITITAKIPLPKNAAAAVSETLAQTYFAREACNALQRNQVWPEMHIEQIEADAAEPAPAPKRRGRKPRAALGSSPLAPKRELTDEEKQAEIMKAYQAFKDQKAPPQQRATGLPPTTGADGEDLLAIPPHLDRRAHGAKT